jgi:diamine N-acetyltransferase
MAKEALKLFMEYAFSVLGIHNLYCNVAQSNSISIQLFTSLGFNPIGIKKEWLKVKNGYEDELMFQKINPL